MLGAYAAYIIIESVRSVDAEYKNIHAFTQSPYNMLATLMDFISELVIL